MSELALETLLEATLFGSGKSLSVKDLSESLGYEEDEISEALTSLQGTIKRRRGGALRIVEIGGKWAMEVRSNVAEHLPKETKTEMPKKLLKAAALIAYHQPMPQSRLVELLGQKAYDYVRELSQHGMIMRRRDGNTRRLTTTRRFSEAFGCPHTDLRKVRKWFREQVTEAGMFDGMESEVLKEVGEDGLVQSTLPFEDE
ncbi:MAG: SMC-Scp complex subunit ScpB [Candidatus Poseidoniaceae archaeon]|nr:SMC-Scp complex subunit ScpB [Candidatus Poseidoniaceae archaeon]HII32724.1 SMC-Scp complex subunit ScpB [Candidatus Poseidoniaceae archaeon]HII56082.1 SMC-Scp complex subunit ScpB [Candidatus Poseidoniaceae archaeon]